MPPSGNTIDNYTCPCDPGYTGDGFDSCSGIECVGDIISLLPYSSCKAFSEESASQRNMSNVCTFIIHSLGNEDRENSGRIAVASFFKDSLVAHFFSSFLITTVWPGSKSQTFITKWLALGCL